MPAILSFDAVLDPKVLQEKITQDLPHRKIQGIFLQKGFQVRKSGFTTQNITVQPNQKKNTIKIQSALDMLILYVLICWPIALYIYINKSKHEALKQEVIDKLTEYHTS